MGSKHKHKPPLLVLGGSSNALAIARTMHKHGVDVFLSVMSGNCASYTRFAKKVYPFRDKNKIAEFWQELLIDSPPSVLEGAVIFTCNDDGIEFVAKNREQLKERFILDESIPEIQLLMLNKRKTLDLCKEVGIPHPQFLAIESEADLNKLTDDIMYPIIVKPQHSHIFQKVFNGQKLFFVNNRSELEQRLEAVLQNNLKVILTEMIPGPDSLLGSYYTYIDRAGNRLFHYTKKVIRRYPKNNGQGCYHITDWDEEIAELGLKFFQLAKFRGLGNVEFKRDLRDGQLKIIECNPRFTAAHELLVQCGMDISYIIYNHLVGLPVPKITSYKNGMTLWYPRRDFLAYKELKALNEISFTQWIKSIAHKQVLPHFRFFDPLPTILPFLQSFKLRLLK